MGRLALCLYEGRVAPRYDRTQVAIFIDFDESGILSREPVAIGHLDSHEICEMIASRRAGVVICGGIKGDCREKLEGRGVRILDNIIGSADKVISEFLAHNLRSGKAID